MVLPAHGARRGCSVTPFYADDGPRIAIETDERNRHHRIMIPSDLRMPLIQLLRRVQNGANKVSDRPLTVTRVSSLAVSGQVSRYVVVQYHERVPGNGVRLRKLPIRQDELDVLIQGLYSNTPAAQHAVRPDLPLESFFGPST